VSFSIHGDLRESKSGRLYTRHRAAQRRTSIIFAFCLPKQPVSLKLTPWHANAKSGVRPVTGLAEDGTVHASSPVASFSPSARPNGRLGPVAGRPAIAILKWKSENAIHLAGRVFSVLVGRHELLFPQTRKPWFMPDEYDVPK
jgi:hypothetical protein